VIRRLVTTIVLIAALAACSPLGNQDCPREGGIGGTGDCSTEQTLADNLIVPKSEDGWHAVSLDGRDDRFGWVESRHLAPSDQMPDWR